MYPNQNQPQYTPPPAPSPTPTPTPEPAPQGPNQYPIDYLNQIAPKPQKNGMDNKKFLFLVGGGLLIALIVGIFAFTSSGSGPTDQMQTLAARINTLQKVSSSSQKNIKSSQLRSVNGSLTLLLTNASHDMAAPLKTNGVDVLKLNTTIVKAEAGTDLTNKLEDARLNAVFDRTYAREMSYQINTVHALMKQIYAKTNSKSLKDFLNETDTNLTPINKQLQDFNAANG